MMNYLFYLVKENSKISWQWIIHFFKSNDVDDIIIMQHC